MQWWIRSERIILEAGNTSTFYSLCELIVGAECGKVLTSYCCCVTFQNSAVLKTSWARTVCLLTITCSRTHSTSKSIFFFERAKWWGREANPSPQSSAEVKMMGGLTLLHVHTFTTLTGKTLPHLYFLWMLEVTDERNYIDYFR